MCDHANIGRSKGRKVLRKHLLGKGCRILPSEASVLKLSDGAIVPTTKSITLGTMTYDSSYRDLMTLIKHYLKQKLEEHGPQNCLNSMDLIFGGDHGFGAERDS